eukprot:548863-Prorocentrum_minimum.AAC.1
MAEFVKLGSSRFHWVHPGSSRVHLGPGVFPLGSGWGDALGHPVGSQVDVAHHNHVGEVQRHRDPSEELHRPREAQSAQAGAPAVQREPHDHLRRIDHTVTTRATRLPASVGGIRKGRLGQSVRDVRGVRGYALAAS